MRPEQKTDDAGHEAVAQALLITAVGAGALGAAALGRLVVGNLDALMNTLSTLT
jgi:hypothetical protein